MSSLDLGAKYQILEALGKDQTGTLYKARQILLDRVVAVKVLNPAYLSTTEKASLLVRDVRLAAELNHPNIVSVHDIDKTNDGGKETIFIVTEFISGPTLSQYLEKHPIPPLSETLRIGGELCQGLAYAHKVGLSHQNLNPDMVLLSGGRQVKIADFGIASGISASAKGKESPLIGKPGYLAPEQINRKPDSAITPAVDIYAVGVLLYEMVTSSGPFAGPTPMDILTKQFKGTITPPSQINGKTPQLLEQVILATLQKVPGDRPPSAAHLFAYLDKVFRESCESKMVLESSGELRVSEKMSPAASSAAAAPAAARSGAQPSAERPIQPTAQPTIQPTAQPTIQPTAQATAQPVSVSEPTVSVSREVPAVKPTPAQRTKAPATPPQPAYPQSVVSPLGAAVPTSPPAAAPTTVPPTTAPSPPQREGVGPADGQKALRQSSGKIDVTLPPPKRRPFLRKIAYSGMVASLVSILIIVIFGIDVNLWPKTKKPKIKKDIQGVVIERPQRQMVQVSWMSKNPYVGQLVMAKRSKHKTKAVTSRRVVVESKETKEHRLVYQGLKAHEDYTVSLLNEKTGELLHQFNLSGRARLIGGPYVFSRRGSADIDWVSDVRLTNPRVLVRTDRVKRDNSPSVVVKARQTQLEDKTYRYTATFVNYSPDPVFAEIAGMEEKSCQSIRVVLEAEIIASTKPEVRPMFTLASNRYILDQLEKVDSRYARNVRQMLPPWAQRELAKERRNHYACYVAGPMVVDNQLIVGDQAGTVYSYALTGDEAFKVDRSALDLAWVYFDKVANYDSCTELASDGENILAQMVRARPDPTRIRARDREVSDEYERKSEKILKSFLAGKELGKQDQLVVLNAKERQKDRAERLRDNVFNELLSDETSRTIQSRWGERAEPTNVSRSAKSNELKTELSRALRWCLSTDKKSLAAVQYADWLKPKGQYILRTKDLNNPSSPWIEGLDNLATTNVQPICHENVVYTVSLTREAEDLSELDRPAPSFISAYDLQSKRSWRFSTTGTLQFTQLFFDDYRHRVYFCSHDRVYSLDHGLRTKMLRDNEDIVDGFLTSTNEFSIPVDRIVGLLPPKERGVTVGKDSKKSKRYLLATPIIFAPRRWKGKRELILLCLNSPTEASSALAQAVRHGHLGASLYMFDFNGDALTRYVPFVARGADESYCRIVSGMPPDALYHFIQQQENGVCLFSLMGRTLVFDLNEEPTVDLLSGMQRHILLDHAPIGMRFRRMFLHGSTIYYSDMGGRLRRMAFSPTRLPKMRERTPLPILQGQEDGEANSSRRQALETKRGESREAERRKRQRGQRQFENQPGEGEENDGPPERYDGDPPEHLR